MMKMFGVQQSDQDVHIQQCPHQSPDSSRSRSISSLVTMPPRLGNGRKPNSALGSGTWPFASFRPPRANDCRRKRDITAPADLDSRLATSFTAMSRSSSIFTVVRTIEPRQQVRCIDASTSHISHQWGDRLACRWCMRRWHIPPTGAFQSMPQRCRNGRVGGVVTEPLPPADRARRWGWRRTRSEPTKPAVIGPTAGAAAFAAGRVEAAATDRFFSNLAPRLRAVAAPIRVRSTGGARLL